MTGEETVSVRSDGAHQRVPGARCDDRSGASNSTSTASCPDNRCRPSGPRIVADRREYRAHAARRVGSGYPSADHCVEGPRQMRSSLGSGATNHAQRYRRSSRISFRPKSFLSELIRQTGVVPAPFGCHSRPTPIRRRCVRTILVVDDEWAIAEVLEALLGDEGYRVIIANNGRQAPRTPYRVAARSRHARFHDAGHGRQGDPSRRSGENPKTSGIPVVDDELAARRDHRGTLFRVRAISPETVPHMRRYSTR